MGDIRGTPVFIESKNNPGKILERVQLSEKFVSEGWLQEKIRLHPGLLPISEIEPGLGAHTAIGREVNAGGGSIDNLYITASGVLVIAECKLWRNRQQAREVLAQLLDYARVVKNWRYGDIDEIAKAYFKSYKLPFGSLYEALKASSKNLPPENEFSDAVDKNLGEGKMLLLVVGEGIREGLRGMAELVGKSPDMFYRVALIEVGLYRMGSGEWPIFGVPTVVAESVELPRGVIHVKYEQDHKPAIEVSDVDNALVANTATKTTITESMFLEEVDSLLQKSTLSAKRAEAVKKCLGIVKAEFDTKWLRGMDHSSFHAKFNDNTVLYIYTKAASAPRSSPRLQSGRRLL